MAKSVISAYPEIVSTDLSYLQYQLILLKIKENLLKNTESLILHLSDPKKETCKKYAGLNLAGLAKRSTFIIDKHGIIKKIFRTLMLKTMVKKLQISSKNYSILGILIKL